MRRISLGFPLLLGALAACGNGAQRVTIRGDFADSAAVPTTVWAVEAEREAEVKRGAFEIGDLSAGPVTLRLVRGADTVGTLALHNVPAGARLTLSGLQTDGGTHRAFPRALGMDGTRLLLVNGIRMGGADALPDSVDARGTVLAASDDRAALLVRPADAALPDLRVVAGLGTETVAPDGAAADLAGVGAGDSVRVEGRVDQGFVVATRLTVPRRAVASATPAADAETEEAPAPAAEERADAAPPAAPVAASAPIRVAREVRARIGRGGPGAPRGRGHGRGKGRKG